MAHKREDIIKRTTQAGAWTQHVGLAEGSEEDEFELL
jgi:hypothetical protein